MPARKPLVLITRATTIAEREARAAAEAAITPSSKLSTTPPAALKSHRVASTMWKKIIKLYARVNGVIATPFDEDLLIQYCLLIEELPWLEDMRTALDKEYKAIEKLVSQNRGVKISDESFKNYLRLLEQYNGLLARLQGIDARLDGKRKLIHSLAQSLYMTPRSRAGVAPPQKENKPKDNFGNEFD